MTNHEQSLLSFARYLETAMEHTGEAAVAAYYRLKEEYQRNLEAKIDVAKERFNMFLQETKTHMKSKDRDGSKPNSVPITGESQH